MIYLMLPAYNEAPEIKPLFTSVDKVLADLDEELMVILVDDASTDGTDEIARQTSTQVEIKILRHVTNQGLGGALLTGFQSILDENPSDDDVIITMDTDNTHSPSYIPPLVKKIRLEELDLIVASRYAEGGTEEGVSYTRRLLSRAASFFYRWFYRTPGISDYTCGYRAYRVGIIRMGLERFGNLFIEEKGFSSTGEVLLKIRTIGGRMNEIPFALHYERKNTPSKMPKIKTILSTLKILLKYRSLANRPD